MANHLNKREVIHRNLMIKYHDKSAPDDTTKRKLIAATQEARAVMRSVVWRMDKVVFFGRDEADYFAKTMVQHFGLGKPKGAERTRYLNKIRHIMLGISFNLNTGTYLLDIDNQNRKVQSGRTLDPTNDPKDDLKETEGYITVMKGLGLTITGPIHLDFKRAAKYSKTATARVIIHEASHTFCKTEDVAYNWDPAYNMMSLDDAVRNADSYAYAAMSLASKKLVTHQSLKKAGEH